MHRKLKNRQSCSVIILAAGYSKRMGKAKFALEFKDQFTFLEAIVEKYKSFGCKEIIVVLSSKGISCFKQKKINLSADVKIVVNHHPEWERFFSIKTALKAVERKQNIFIHNIDNPFISLNVLEKLSANISDSDFIVPIYKGRGGHPILLSKNIIKNILSEENNDLNFRNVLLKFKKQVIDVDDENILVNINSGKEYNDLIRKL